jgi:transposase-like protein
VVECLEKDLEDCLAFYKQPFRRWKRIRSTNVIERCFKEFRRRISAMDSFPTEESCLRIMFGLARMMNESWEGKLIKEF